MGPCERNYATRRGQVDIGDGMRREGKSDLRVIKTRMAIKSAFKEMLNEMAPSEITVSELSERAMIHRKTFYLHYTSIEALFEDMIQDSVSEYARLMDTIEPDAPFTEVNRIFFEFMTTREPYVERMICSQEYNSFTDRMILYSLKHNRSRYNPYSRFPPEEQNIINTFLALGSMNIYRRWVQDGKKVPVEELIGLSGKLMSGGVNSVIERR